MTLALELWLQLFDVVCELHGLVSERRAGNKPKEEHPSLHSQPEEEAQEEENQVLPGVQAWRPVGAQQRNTPVQHFPSCLFWAL